MAASWNDTGWAVDKKMDDLSPGCLKDITIASLLTPDLTSRSSWQVRFDTAPCSEATLRSSTGPPNSKLLSHKPGKDP